MGLFSKLKDLITRKKEVVEEVKEEPVEESKEEAVEEKIVEVKETIEIDNDYNNQVINNCFAKADKQYKQMFEEKWQALYDYALDSKLGAAASFLTDGVIRAASENELIISFTYESMINRGINLLEQINTLFKKLFDKEYDIAFISDEEWERQKKLFIENKNNGIEYEYKPIIKEKKKVERKKKTTITDQAIDLFGDDVVSV